MALLKLRLITIFSTFVCCFVLFSPLRSKWIFNRPSQLDQNLSIGISLTAHHGTISIRHDNGTFEDIGRVDAEQDYIDMMQDFNQKSSQHPSPPYESFGDAWNDQPRQWLRAARRMLGLPASADVGRLSQMTSSLLNLARDHRLSPFSIGSAVITFPQLYGLYVEDIKDTAIHNSLPLLDGRHMNSPTTLASAYAGYGMGLCSSWFNLTKCIEEEDQLPRRATVLVEYTSTALHLHAYEIQRAWNIFEIGQHFTTYFFAPGQDYLVRNATGHEGRIEIVHELVGTLIYDRWKQYGWPIEQPKEITVLLTGTAADFETDGVEEAAESAVRALDYEVAMFGKNVEFMAARGAAEMAWRALQLQKGRNLEL